MNRRELLLGALGAPFLSSTELQHPDGRELTGRQAPPLGIKQWLHSPPLEMTGLRGKVVLLRWWTNGCPFCEATAPALRKFQAEYGDRGLQIIGVYHPKPPAKPPGIVDLSAVESDARKKQFTFPLAIDAYWSALKRWWLDRERDYTSVSFLVDRKGVIRYVHPGGEFHEGSQGGFATHESCNRDFHAIDKEIVKLLSE